MANDPAENSGAQTNGVSRAKAPCDDTSEAFAHFDSVAAEWDSRAARTRGFHDQIVRYFRYCVPEGKRVLEIGCATGDLLNALKPSRGVGVDFSPKMIEIAKTKHPHLEFHLATAEDFDADGPFDFIIMDSLVGSLRDIEEVLHRVAALCRPETRVILSYHNTLLEPVFRLAEWLGWRRKQPLQNWLSRQQAANLMRLAGLRLIRIDDRHFFPFRVPALETILERFVGRLPFFRNFNLMSYAVARFVERPRIATPTVTVVCPCRNEAGNVMQVVERLPTLGVGTELIFVEGNSTDDTLRKCQEAIAAHAEKNIKLIQQGAGRGKGDAVRKGYAAATGDILMILDADMTVPPEDLPKFVAAISSEKGEFINGTRLVYPMEKDAMRFLNKIGNKVFSGIFTWILRQPLTDTLCGTKVMWRKDYEELAANRAYFGEFDPFGDFDLIFGAAKMGLEILEVPIRYRERTYGATNISRFRHGLLLFRMSALAARRIRFH